MAYTFGQTMTSGGVTYTYVPDSTASSGGRFVAAGTPLYNSYMASRTAPTAYKAPTTTTTYRAPTTTTTTLVKPLSGPIPAPAPAPTSSYQPTYKLPYAYSGPLPAGYTGAPINTALQQPTYPTNTTSGTTTYIPPPPTSTINPTLAATISKPPTVSPPPTMSTLIPKYQAQLPTVPSISQALSSAPPVPSVSQTVAGMQAPSSVAGMLAGMPAPTSVFSKTSALPQPGSLTNVFNSLQKPGSVSEAFSQIDRPASLADEFAQYSPYYIEGKPQDYYDIQKENLRDALRSEFFGPLGTAQGVASQESTAGRLGSGVGQRVLEEAVMKPYIGSFIQIDRDIAQLQMEEQARVETFNADQYNHYVDRLSTLRTADVNTQLEFGKMQLSAAQSDAQITLQVAGLAMQAAQGDQTARLEMNKLLSSAAIADNATMVQLRTLAVQAAQGDQQAILAMQKLRADAAQADAQIQTQLTQLRTQAAQADAQIKTQMTQLAFQAAQAEAGQLSTLAAAQLEANVRVWEAAAEQYVKEQEIAQRAFTDYNNYMIDLTKAQQEQQRINLERQRIATELATAPIEGTNQDLSGRIITGLGY